MRMIVGLLLTIINGIAIAALVYLTMLMTSGF